MNPLSFDPARWRPAPLLPAGTARPFWLFWLAAICCCVAGLAGIAGLEALRVGGAMAPRLSGRMTVSVSGTGLESPDAAAARAAEIIGQVPGVASTRILDPAPIDPLAGVILSTWAGTGRGGPTRLISVACEASAKPDAATLASALRAQRMTAQIDDHGWWSGRLERTAWLSGLAVGLALLAAMAAIYGVGAAAARSGLATQRGRIRIMYRMGASDGFLAGLIGGAVTGAVLSGAVVGAALAGGLAFWLLRGGDRVGSWSVPGLAGFGPWALLALLPVIGIATGLGALAARRAAIRAIRRFP